MIPHYRLLTLGAPLLLSAAGEIVRFRTRKHFGLLIRIALEPGRRLARDNLVDLLWPATTTQRGRHSLSQAITVLRRTIGRQAVVTQRATLALEPGVVSVDVLELESANVEIRGRFLEGFEIPGARGFAEWREGWSARLDTCVRDYLVNRMQEARRLGDYPTLERLAIQMEEHDPLSEDAVRGIMEARAWAGDRPNALKVFDRHAQRLVAELRAKPTQELARVADMLREGRRVVVRPRDDNVASSPDERRFQAEAILGRERELAELYSAWTAVRLGKPRLVLVLGDHGIGKTTLTNGFASSCQMQGAVIARAQAFEIEKNLPYAVLAELVRQLTQQRAIGAADPIALAELARLVPEIHAVFPGVPQPADCPPEVVPLRLAEAFLKVVSAAVDEAPAVLLVDDVHLADVASMATLHILVRKLTGMRILLLFTARGWESSAAAVALGIEGHPVAEALLTMELEPLSDEAATQLVRRECPPDYAPWGEPPFAELVRCGWGNPLALELLTRDWVKQGSESVVCRMGDSAMPGARKLALPQTVRLMVERQAQQLERKTRAVLDLAAVLGRRIGDLCLYRVIGCAEGEALYRLTQLLDAHLLRDVAGQVEFRNELVRVHAYYDIPSAVRFELHRRLGNMLEQYSGPDGERPDIEIAWHYIAGTDLARAIPFALSGAEKSLNAGASREAERVLTTVEPSIGEPATRRRLLLLLAAAKLSQSKAEEALSDLDGVVNDDGAPKPAIAQATRLYASAMYLINQNSTAKHSEMATRAAAVARECGDRELLARALFECARAGVESGNEKMVRDSREELRKHVILDSRDVPAIAHHADAYCSYFLLDIGDACQAARTAVEKLARTGSVGDLSLASTGLGNCEMALCHLEQARSAYEAALALARKMGDECRISIVNSNLAASYLMSGDIGRAIEYGEESLKVGSQAPAQPGLLRTWSNLAFAYVLAGRMDAARECFVAWQHWIRNGRSWSAWMEYWCDSASIELVFGNIGGALRLIAQAEEAYLRSGNLFVNQGAFERLRVFSAYQTRGQEAARAFAALALDQFRGRHTMAYLDAVAAQAWTEKRSTGDLSDKTTEELKLFQTYGVPGKRDVLAAQGFVLGPS